MHNLDWALKEYRNNELVADFKSQCSEPVMITSLEVYKRFASNCFTCNIFKEIRNKIQKVETLNIKLLSTIVDKLFESRGIPCSHIFCAMKYENLLDFSESLIYKSKLCDLACKNNVDFEEVHLEIIKLIIICLQSRAPSRVGFRGGKKEHALIATGMAIITSDVQMMHKTKQANPCEATNENASAKVDFTQQKNGFEVGDTGRMQKQESLRVCNNNYGRWVIRCNNSGRIEQCSVGSNTHGREAREGWRRDTARRKHFPESTAATKETRHE
ncbi:hypothetical protein AHAS_Ahas19G0109900 [Arachis hypogaea]